MPASIPILMFHSLDDMDSPLSFPPEMFRTGMAWLRGRNFRSLTVTETAACLRGTSAAPERAFAISFDDGYRSVFEIALPVLKELGYSATLYVNDRGETSQLAPMEGRPRLTWDEIRELRESGFEIGAHSLTHPNLTRLREPAMQAENAGSQTLIEQRLGSPVTSFAYPFGFSNPSVRSFVSRRFRCACTTDLAVATSACDVYALPRLEMHYFRTTRTFRLLAGPGLSAYLHVRRVPRLVRQRFIL